MKKGLIFTVIAVVILAGLVFGSDLSGFANMAAEPKPGS
jgi:hypothetical protein